MFWGGWVGGCVCFRRSSASFGRNCWHGWSRLSWRGTTQMDNYVENPELGIPQSEMSRLCPPGCSVWRDNVRGAWSVHLPPWKRFSRPFWVFGEQGAGLEAMREAWRLYLRNKGMDFSECTIESFFTQAPSASASSTAGSASAAASSRPRAAASSGSAAPS